MEAIWIHVTSIGSIHFIVSYDVDTHECDTHYHFADWKHCLAHFGPILPLIRCKIFVSEA